MQQIKSRENVRSRGEVFTAEREVKAMCDLVGKDIADIEKRILEPAAGNGNFLVEILNRRIKNIDGKNHPADGSREFCLLVALSNIYAVEIDEENVRETRQRLKEIMLAAVNKITPNYESAVETLLQTNIIRGDFLSKNNWIAKIIEKGGGKEGVQVSAPIPNSSPLTMPFDIVIGNPPYQQSDGGHAASAMAIYHHFVRQAKRLNPRYISLIIPARWYSGGKGLDSFREEMLGDEHIRVLHDYPNSKDCFPNVQIEGGVCYFLRNRDEAGECRIITHIDGENWDSKRMLRSPYVDTFIRYPQQLSVVEKVWKDSTAESFTSLVSPRKPFGLATDLFKDPKKYGLPPVNVTKIDGGFTIYGLGEKMQRAERYVTADYPLPHQNGDIDKWKVFVPKALGTSKENSQDKVLGDSFVGSPKSLCTETYLSIGSFRTQSEAENCLSYIKTKFLRFLVGIIKMTQNTTRRVYHLVPMQDFSESWTDAKLYAKYNLTDSEIAFIEKMIREMP